MGIKRRIVPRVRLSYATTPIYGANGQTEFYRYFNLLLSTTEYSGGLGTSYTDMPTADRRVHLPSGMFREVLLAKTGGAVVFTTKEINALLVFIGQESRLRRRHSYDKKSKDHMRATLWRLYTEVQMNRYGKNMVLSRIK